MSGVKMFCNSQQVLDLADHALARLPPIWRNWITRIISGVCLISGFSFLISLGPIGLFFLVSDIASLSSELLFLN